MARLVVGRVGEHPLPLAVQPPRLELERALERLGVLEPARVLLLVVRVGPLDRVAQHRDHLRASGTAAAARAGPCGWNR